MYINVSCGSICLSAFLIHQNPLYTKIILFKCNLQGVNVCNYTDQRTQAMQFTANNKLFIKFMGMRY